MIRKIKNYEVTTEDNKVTNIVKNSSNGRTTGHAYRYDNKLQAWEKLTNIKFSTLKNGIYKGIIEIF